MKIRSCFEIKYSCLSSSPRKPPAIGNLSDVLRQLFCDHIFQCTSVLSFKRALYKSPVRNRVLILVFQEAAILDLTGKEVTFLIKKSLSGRVGWKIMPEDDNLNLKINATILEQVMARIRWKQKLGTNLDMGIKSIKNCNQAVKKGLTKIPLQGHAVFWRGGPGKNVNCDTIIILSNITLVSSSSYTLIFNHASKIYIFILLPKSQLTWLIVEKGLIEVSESAGNVSGVFGDVEQRGSRSQ